MKSIIVMLMSVVLCAWKSDHHKGQFKLTLSEAERILGEPSKLEQGKDTVRNGVYQYRSTYVTSGNTKGALYYMFEVYNSEADNKKQFEEYRVSNQSHQGFELRKDLGDRAFFHSDGKNFGLIVGCKGKIMIRIKVNKVTPKTSTAELTRIARDILARV